MNKALTLEHISPGIFPDWLFQHLCSQTLNPNENTYLIVHSSDAARAEIIERLEGKNIGPIDRSRHHTLQSLRISLHADLRLPRLLPSDASGARLLHAECQLGAQAGDFPALHPSPEWKWGEGRTRALARLCQVFDTEDVRRWDGPGMDGFRSRLTRMGSALNGTHPLLQHRTLIDALESKEDAPFMLAGVIGIILMDQPPTLSQSDRRILQSLRRFRPIHQLCQHGDATIGNHRLGLHGAILEDVMPCTQETLPDWLPTHTPWTPTVVEQSIHRLLVPRRGLAIEASLEVLRDWLQGAPPDADVLIIDPNWQERTSAWTRGLTEVGLRPPRQSRTINSTPVIHWLGELVSIGIGPDAWSMERLRGLGTQKSLSFDEEWSKSALHPVHDDWNPDMDPERIESLGRIWHIMGGHGALGRWLQALSSKPHPAPWETEEEAAVRAECTQWWFLTLLARLAPLLSAGERTLLSDEKFHVGCATGAILPLPEMASTGDEWLTSLTKHIDWERLLEDAGALQRLLEGYTNLRRSQTILNHRPATTGSRWIEDFLGLLEDVNVPTIVEASDRVRLLTPEDALGTSADLILLTHLTSTQWNLSTERLPWMNEEERTRLNLNRPDAPLRHARHVLHHLLHASQQTILIDATGLDEDAQPAAPLSEWFADQSGSESPDEVQRPSFMSDNSRWETAISNITRGYHLGWRPSRIEIIQQKDQSWVETLLSGRGQRNKRQQSGLALHAAREPDYPPLNPDSVSIPLDAHVMQDRLRRQPSIVPDESDYLSMDLHDRFIAPGTLRIVPTASGASGVIKPRHATSWPVLGGKDGRNHLLATDPRPFAPSATKLPVFDIRNGQTDGAVLARPIWSASRLKKWQDCPRQGWLERRLGAGQLEDLKEDLDARIRGNLIHGALGAVFEHALGIPEHSERPSKDATSLHGTGQKPEELFVYVLDYLAQHAPWLEREDATATQRRHDLIGLSRDEWLDWLASPKPMSPTGRLGQMLLAELELKNSIPISVEWSLNGIEIPHPDGRKIRMSGYIDRVDIVNILDLDSDVSTIAPLDWTPDSDWNPQRLVLIRDIKSIDGPKKEKIGERHRKALFDELQLAIYARAWEIAHPGDLVIGAGISEIGAVTCHRLEISPHYFVEMSENMIGEVTCYTHDTHRLTEEGPTSPTSDAFRAWMQERLSTAINVATAANEGRVIATPSEEVCRWCDVKQACGLAPIVGGDRSWN